MDAVLDIAKPFEGVILSLLIIAARLYGFFSTTHVLPQAISGRTVRTLIVVVFSLPLVGFVQGQDLPTTFGLDFFAVVFCEFFKGYVLGFSIGWIFWVLEGVGNVIDNQRGAAVATAVNPLLGQEASPVAILFSQAMTAYFYAIGGMFIFFNIFYLSYQIFPAGALLPVFSVQSGQVILTILSRSFKLMFLLAAPIVAIMFIVEFALAMVSRFAPQIQVFILAMPIKSAVAIFMLIFFFKIALDYAANPPERFYNYANSVIRLLGSDKAYQDVVPRAGARP